jgi:hypothetical protein
VETAENRWNLSLNHWTNASAKIGKAPRLILVGEHAHAAIQLYWGSAESSDPGRPVHTNGKRNPFNWGERRSKTSYVIAFPAISAERHCGF